MPNITPYDAGNLAIRPSEVGVESQAAAGRRLGAYGSQIAGAYERAGQELSRGIREAGDAAVNYADHQQINAGADHGATLFANLTESWNQTAAGADPHDPSVAKKWRDEQLEPALTQFTDGFTTEKSQEWANRFANNLRSHMFSKTEADMSSMASIAVANTVHNMSNKLSNAAITDPSGVPAMLDSVDHSIEGILAVNPNIKGPDAAKVRLEVGDKIKEQIIKSGAFGAISNAADPEAAAATWAAKYPKYINGAEELTLARAARTQVRTNTLLAKQQEIAERQIGRDNVEASRNKIWSDNVTTGPNGEVQIKPDFFRQASRIPMENPKAPNATETAKTLIDWGERQQKPGKIASDPATAADLDGRMFAADNPTTALDVLKAEAAGKLNHADGTLRRALIKERDTEPVKDPMFKPAMDGAKQLIEGFDRKLATGKFAGFQQAFLSEYLKEKRDGTLPPNALNLNDPESLISKVLAPYRSPLADIISAGGGVGAPANSAPLPVYTEPAKGASFAERFAATGGTPQAPPVSLPPVAKRVRGQSYMTGRGMMQWTGTGWIAPQAETLQPGQM